MEEEREEYLLLSGIQHFAFCPRQWALAYIDGVWEENFLTAQGRLLHEKADDPWFNELRKDRIISRSMPVRSDRLRIQGVADIVELTSDDNGVSVPGKKGTWLLRPVEYKRGKPKSEDCDKLQLCAQAMCLEEMLRAEIASGEIFYGQTRRRIEVSFSETLRASVLRIVEKMHEMFTKAEIPIAKREKSCRACSLIDTCQPGLNIRTGKVSVYIERMLAEDDSDKQE